MKKVDIVLSPQAQNSNLIYFHGVYDETGVTLTIDTGVTVDVTDPTGTVTNYALGTIITTTATIGVYRVKTSLPLIGDYYFRIKETIGRNTTILVPVLN